ncbi:anionic peroxidase swpb3, partial [Genlisea aurea]
AAVIFLLLALFMAGSSSAQLSYDYYWDSCPDLFPTVRSVVRSAIQAEPRIGASILRLFFHDCFVNGCDGSILLDDGPNFVGEKGATPNRNSARGFEVVDRIKAAVEYVCPGVVSCADILAVASRDSVEILGGPGWDVKLGRRDAKTASLAAANSNIPPPRSNLTALVTSFASHGLSVRDLVVLSGSHTIGQARCTSFRPRIYNETNIEPYLARIRKYNCPEINGTGDNNLAPLDPQTPTRFDNFYFRNLVDKAGLLHSDQELFNGGGSTDWLVRYYAENPYAFLRDFPTAMIRMGDIKPLTGFAGEIRANCRKVN